MGASCFSKVRNCHRNCSASRQRRRGRGCRWGADAPHLHLLFPFISGMRLPPPGVYPKEWEPHVFQRSEIVIVTAQPLDREGEAGGVGGGRMPPTHTSSSLSPVCGLSSYLSSTNALAVSLPYSRIIVPSRSKLNLDSNHSSVGISPAGFTTVPASGIGNPSRSRPVPLLTNSCSLNGSHVPFII